MTEVKYYLGIIATAIVLIMLNTRDYYDSVFLNLHHTAFQVGSIITTTGFATVDFDLWPNLSRTIMVILMLIGACAGSTGGGLKVSRLVLLVKGIKQDIQRYIHPRGITRATMDGRCVSNEIVQGVATYLATYVLIFGISIFLVSLFDPNLDLVSIFTSVAATINNIGPGLSSVGPMANYAHLSVASKYVLMFDMLAGRLELYPMLLLIYPGTWKRK